MDNNVIDFEKGKEIELKKYYNKIRYARFASIKKTNNRNVFETYSFAPYIMGFIYDRNFIQLDEKNKTYSIYPINSDILNNIYSYTKPGLYVVEIYMPSIDHLGDFDFYLDFIEKNISLLHIVDREYEKYKKTGNIPYADSNDFLYYADAKVDELNNNVVSFKKGKYKLVFNKFVNKITSITNHKKK